MAQRKEAIDTSLEVVFTIEERLNEMRISRRELARRIGLAQEPTRRIVNGLSTRITVDVIAKLCEVLNCEVSDIMYVQPKAKASEKRTDTTSQ